MVAQKNKCFIWSRSPGGKRRSESEQLFIYASYAGLRPYNIIPYQWSVHLQRSPGGTLEHFEFLADATGDPRKDFIVSLLPVLEDPGSGGHIVVYNRTFENGRLTNLAR